jgi:PAS domain S-box-containing protein
MRVAELEKALEEARLREERLVTEKAQLAEAAELLEETADRYVDLYDFAPVAFATVDESGVIRQINRNGCALVGMERPKLLGAPLKLVFDRGDRTWFGQYLRRCRRGNIAPITLTVRRPDGTKVLVELVTRRPPGAKESYRIALLDVSERFDAEVKRLAMDEASRAARQTSIAKDQFVAMLSHELRTPLTPLLATLSLLERDPPPGGDELKKLAALLRRNLLVEARLIDDLLDVSRLTHGKMTVKREPMSVHAAARNAFEVFASEIAAKRLWTTVELEAERDLVLGDPIRLRQVFLNIVKNAIKFTRPGDRISLRSWNRDGVVAVEVSDSGVGIGAADLERLFTPFEQGRAAPESGGLGLGLAIAKGVMTLHGGDISASSIGPDKGARFVVELETIKTAPLEAAKTERALPVGNGHHATRILLVEDNDDTAEALSLGLGSIGYEVRVARSIGAALAAELGDIDVVISDLSLPDGRGWDLVRQLRARSPVKAIALSGFGSDDDISASKEAGFDLHLTKPVELSALAAAIARVIGEAPEG